jgi:septum formation protein
MQPQLVLASSSRYRAAMLAEEGLDAVIDPPDVDERALDGHLGELGPSGLALELARRKAASVAPRHPESLVVAGDQVGVLCGERPVMLVKRPDVGGAVDQLMAMSGTTHELHNGLVVLDTATGRRVEGVDVQLVTMRKFTSAEAEQYVQRFEPFDSSGSYRLEDQDEMSPLEPFVVEVRGEHDSGVRGLPLPLLRRLLHELGRP